MNEKVVISKEPWPAKSIYAYSNIHDGEWGYLLIYSDTTFHFDETQRPSDREILARWESYFSSHKEVMQ